MSKSHQPLLLQISFPFCARLAMLKLVSAPFLNPGFSAHYVAGGLAKGYEEMCEGIKRKSDLDLSVVS